MVVLSIFFALIVFSIVVSFPALREIRSKSDAQRLYVDESFVQNPRFPEKSPRGFFTSRSETGHEPEDIPELSAAHAHGSAEMLAADGALLLKQNIVAARNSFLGTLTSSEKSVHLDEGSTFTRLFGLPVMTESRRENLTFSSPSMHDADQSCGDVLVPEGASLHENLISEKSIQIGADAIVIGSIKSNGSLEILEGARVLGNIFARGDLHLHHKVVIAGTVYGEREVRCEDQVQIGTPSAYVSIFSGGAMSISLGVRVYGWVLAKGGGVVR